MQRNLPLIASGLTGVLLLVCLVLFLDARRAPGALDPDAPYTGTEIDPRPAPDFSLVDALGNTHSLGELRGRPVILTFLDPHCRDTCPIIAAELVALHRRLAGRSPDLALVGVNTNPAAGRQEDLVRFASAFGLDASVDWRFLTGTPEQLEPVWKSYGIASVRGAGDRLEHTSGVFLIDPSGDLRLYLSVPLGQENAPRVSDVLFQKMQDL